MGRDNHPRERQAQKLARKKASRGRYPRVLIVCEGKKTEPNYFEEIRREFRLHTANVRVLPSVLRLARSRRRFLGPTRPDEGRPLLPHNRCTTLWEEQQDRGRCRGIRVESPGIEALCGSPKMVLRTRHLAVFLEDSSVASAQYVSIRTARFRFRQLPQGK